MNPSDPYTEAGFTFTPFNGESALFGFVPSYPSLFPGDDTRFLLFDANNTITLTGPVPFSLDSALIGPTAYPFGNGPLDLTIIGNVLGGGTVSVTFYNLTTATEEVIGFENLQSATFSGTHSAGLDDISTNGTVPEPGSLFLAGATLLLGGLVCIKRVRRCSGIIC